MPRANPPKRRGLSNVARHVRLYEQKRPLYLAFTGKLDGLLRDLLEGSKIEYHIIESRAKEVQSFREKISRVNKRYSDPLNEITDLAGLRVIVYYLEDVVAASQLIEREFSVDQTSSLDKGELLKPNEFGYRSVHYVASLRAARADLPEWHSFAGLPAEIQIRTVLQHAWASISHTLDYKREEEVPSILRRKLSRLAGLLELSDEEFSDLRMKERELSGNVVHDLERGDKNIEINALSIQGYFDESDLDFISDAANSAGFEMISEDRDNSELIQLCTQFGLTSIKQLDTALQQSRTWVQAYLLDQYTAGNPGHFWSANMPFIVELILMAQNSNNIEVNLLVANGWGKSIAESVVLTAIRWHSKVRV